MFFDMFFKSNTLLFKLFWTSGSKQYCKIHTSYTCVSIFLLVQETIGNKAHLSTLLYTKHKWKQFTGNRHTLAPLTALTDWIAVQNTKFLINFFLIVQSYIFVHLNIVVYWGRGGGFKSSKIQHNYCFFCYESV